MMPDQLKPGFKFTHIDGEFTAVVQEIHEGDGLNLLVVKVCGVEEWSQPWQEDWNLEHTRNGFEDGTYVALEEK